MVDLKTAMEESAQAVEAELDRLLSREDAPEKRLIEAMRHAVLGGGKRVRPFLVMQSGALFGVSEQSRLRTAAAPPRAATHTHTATRPLARPRRLSAAAFTFLSARPGHSRTNTHARTAARGVARAVCGTRSTFRRSLGH